jgi:hypothetical protein
MTTLASLCVTLPTYASVPPMCLCVCGTWHLCYLCDICVCAISLCRLYVYHVCECHESFAPLSLSYVSAACMSLCLDVYVFMCGISVSRLYVYVMCEWHE